MPAHHTPGIIPTAKVHLTLHVKVDNTHYAVLAQQTAHRVNHGIELWDHGEGVAHSDEFGATGIGVLVEVADGLGLGAGGELGLVLVEAEGAGVLADYFDVLPAEAVEALAGHFAEAWGEVDDVWVLG